MVAKFTLEYWKDGNWYVGKLREAPGVFSQGATLDELKENIRDAYQMMADVEEPVIRTRVRRCKIGVEV